MWAQFAELGLLMAPFSEEDGGLGGGPIDAMVVMEEFGKGLVVEPYLPSVVCGGGFLKRGNDAQKAEYLGGIMSGEAIFAFAYAEPRGRYNLADLETTAKKDGSGFVLNGHKAVVIGAPWATHFVVTARTSGDRRDAKGVTVFVVAKDAKGVSTRDYPTVDGRRASEVYFENVAVSADAVIGEVDNGLPLVELVADEAIAALCAEACGAMKVAHAMTVEYSRNRKQFGTAIGKFQVLQHQGAYRPGRAFRRPAGDPDPWRHGHDGRDGCWPLLQASDHDRCRVRQCGPSPEALHRTFGCGRTNGG